MEKRGLSTIVTTVIMILLVLVAVEIVWIVVKKVVGDTSEDISLEKLKIDLQITDVVLTAAQDSIDVTVERKIGEGDLSAIRFLVSDGTTTETFDIDTTLEELTQETFTISQTDINGLTEVTEVSIAPIVTTESGGSSVGNIVDTSTQASALTFA